MPGESRPMTVATLRRLMESLEEPETVEEAMREERRAIFTLRLLRFTERSGTNKSPQAA